MTKFIILLNTAFVLGFILGDAFTGFCFQMAFVAGYGLVRFVPGRVWKAIGRATIEMAPWLFLANIDL